MRVELEYVKGKTKPTDIGRLLVEEAFPGATKIRVDCSPSDKFEYVRTGTFEVLTSIVREKGWKPIFIPMKEIKEG